MSTTRRFGIVTDVSGLSTGICVNSLSISESSEIAEARDEQGKVTDLYSYSRAETISLTGVMDTAKGNLAKAGNKITLNQKDYIIDSVSQNQTNTAFVQVTISCRTADNAIITVIAEEAETEAEV